MYLNVFCQSKYFWTEWKTFHCIECIRLDVCCLFHVNLRKHVHIFAEQELGLFDSFKLRLRWHYLQTKSRQDIPPHPHNSKIFNMPSCFSNTNLILLNSKSYKNQWHPLACVLQHKDKLRKLKPLYTSSRRCQLKSFCDKGIYI